MRLLFWRKPKIQDLGSVSFTVPAGSYKASYSIKFDGVNIDKTIVVVPSVSVKPIKQEDKNE